MGCRFEDFDALAKHYPFSEFLTELSAVLDYVASSKDALGVRTLRGFSYAYLFACFHFYQGFMLGSHRDGRAYIEKFEKASRPTFLSRLFRFSPPETIANNYAMFKREAPFVEQALPMYQFILQRCGNYDLYAGAVRKKIDALDDTLSKLGTNLPPDFFRLLDFMDRTPVGKPDSQKAERAFRSPWEKGTS